MKDLSELHGAFLIDKEAGISSFGVIDQLKKLLSEHYQVKIKDLPKLGHGGTLDPFATGLLVVAIGRGVKLLKYFLHSDKTYQATIKFGETTSSGDFTNPVTETCILLPSSLLEIEQACKKFSNSTYLQTPPMTSAKRVDGKRLYEIARRGVTLERKASEQTIYELNAFEYLEPLCQIRASVSSGTYIRVLAQDLASSLGSLGHLTTLRREKSGAFDIKKAISTKDLLQTILKNQQAPLASDQDNYFFISFDQMLQGLTKYELEPHEINPLVQGNINYLNEFYHKLSRIFEPKNQAIALYSQGNLIGTVEQNQQNFVLDRVFKR